MSPRLALLAGLLLVVPGGAARGESCDAGLVLTDADPENGASAIELCERSVAGSPGLVSASYVTADGASDLTEVASGLLGVGLLDAFGPNVSPQRGDRLLALSSGTARAPDDPGFQDPEGFSKGYTSAHPPGLPYEMPACPGVTTGQAHDSAALRLELKAPATAQSFSFRFKLHTTEYPSFICSSFDDWFVALVDPAPPGTAASGGNVAFDSLGNPVAVNSVELLSVCQTGVAGGVEYPCSAGDAELVGTGFEGHAATSWLRASVPVTPGGTLTLTFAIWDSGDGALDATALVDDFRWSSAALAAPITQPAPEPAGGALSAAAALALAGLARRRARYSASTSR